MKTEKTGKMFALIIILYLFIIVFPFIWVGFTSFKPESEIWGENALRIIGDQVTLDHYKALFEAHIFNALKNSLIISSITTIYVTVIASFCAYAIARLQFKFKKLLMIVILGTSMFPQMIVVGPIYRAFVQLGWTNSYFISLP